MRKGGSGLDLAIAMALLVAMGRVDEAEIRGMAFLGELGLDGALRTVPGILPMVAAIDARTVVVPRASYHEACIVGRHEVRPVSHLGELCELFLLPEKPVDADPDWKPPPRPVAWWPDPPPVEPDEPPSFGIDLADVRGQGTARRALEVAAAGGHHLLMVGSPGSGKTMLAKRLATLLPELDPVTALDTTKVHSSAGVPLPSHGLIKLPPFRAPHHTASPVAMVGGGASWLRPGEISLAHGGVLFLDEMAEFSVEVLESLRQPLEEGEVRVVRAQYRVRYPASFLLVGAMNPCPCGEGDRPGACRCSAASRERYSRRLSAPLLDRFDLRIDVGRPDPTDLLVGPPGESSAAVADRVGAARERAAARGLRCNADLHGSVLEAVAPFAPGARDFVELRLRNGSLTGRGVERIRRVALTLADLAGIDPPLDVERVAEAHSLRLPPTFLRSRMVS